MVDLGNKTFYSETFIEPKTTKDRLHQPLYLVQMITNNSTTPNLENLLSMAKTKALYLMSSIHWIAREKCNL